MAFYAVYICINHITFKCISIVCNNLSLAFHPKFQLLYGGSSVKLPSFNVVSSSKCFGFLNFINISLQIFYEVFHNFIMALRCYKNVILAKCSNTVVASFIQWQNISLPSTLRQKCIFSLCSCAVYCFFKFTILSFKTWNEHI